jgi:site-specific recombinase XerD
MTVMINAHLAPIRAFVRAQGRTPKVKGVKQVQRPGQMLDARELGRLINALNGPYGSARRAVALINVMARAGLRVSEALTLKIGDVELGPRSGTLLVRAGKGFAASLLWGGFRLDAVGSRCRGNERLQPQA